MNMANINIGESISISFDSLKAHKLRTFLTLLGIIIGVTTVIGVVSIISGLNKYVETKMFDIGSNDFSISKMPDIITSFEKWKEYQKRKRITYEDYKIVQKNCKNCMFVGARVNTSGKVKYKENILEDVRVRGFTDKDSLILGSIDLESGRHFNEMDIKKHSRVAVIGWDIKDKLFEYVDPLGKWLWIKGNKYRIVGVAEKKGKMLGFSQDNFVIIPITTFFKKYGRYNRSITIAIHTESLKAMENAQDEIRIMLRSKRHLSPKEDDNFSIETQQTYLDFYKSITGTLYLVMTIISAISLLVGGIVIMNIMLVSVTERIKEIGLRKAVGARRRDILFQFLIESVTLSCFGGIIGIIIGFTIAKLISVLTGLPSTVEIWSVIAGILIASFVGLLSGVYPANKAARLDPVEALRM